MGPDASLTPELIQAQSFTTAFRGYDSAEVKTFLARVATEMRAWKERAEGLESAWHSAEERATRPPVLDEDTLMAAVGEETAAILRTARAAAADMRAKAAEESERALAEAKAEAERTVTEARAEAEQARAEATTQADLALTEARAEAERMRQEADAALSGAVAAAEQQASELLSAAREEATQILERAVRESEEIRAQAEKDRQLTVEGANSTRDRILEDLGRRRRVATVQIEQLRAGRERLIESYAVVRRTLEEVQSELSRADTEARAAADDVGRRLRDQTEVELSESSRAMTDPVAPAEDPIAAAEGDVPAESVETTHVEGAVETEAEAAAPGQEPTPEPVETPAEAETAEAETAEAEAAEAETVEAETVEAEAEATEESGSAVDELFARIRATRVAGEPEGSAPDASAEAAAEEPPTVEVTPSVAEDEPAQPETPPAPVGRRGAKKRVGDESVSNGHPRSTVRVIEPEPAPVADAAEDGAEVAVADGDESLMQSREFAVVDLEVNLTRRLKRALQDEQNDVLDRLRNLKEAPTAASLLPDEQAQVARYARAARPLLGEAATAGALFTDETLGLPGRDAPVDVDVADLAEECGSGIVSPLRRRLEQAIEAGGGDDPAVLVESLGAAYREWKTQRIERLAGDVLSAAFSRGSWAAAPGGAHFRWVVEHTEGPCPDCDDDALAGDIPKGEVFPTGQHHPPAHSGCRCLLVPSLPAR